MSHEFPPKLPKETPQEDARDALIEGAREKWGDFNERYRDIIQGYLGTSEIPFTCNPGGWYITLTGEITINADPTFFLERGYSESEALFATFHEARHFLDMIQDPEAFSILAEKVQGKKDIHAAYPKTLFRFYNAIEDIMVNTGVMQTWKAGEKVKNGLYKKFFKSNDFTKDPLHQQFMYALLREAMLPEEPCLVDPKVREKIDTWQKRGGSQKAIDILTATTREGSAKLPPRKRYALIATTLEPIFEELFKEDLQNRDPEKQQDAQGPFEDRHEDAIPDPMDINEVHDAIQKINEEIAQRKNDEFKKNLGVEQKDFEAYQRDFRRIEKHIDDLAEVFQQILQKRTSYRRVLRRRTKEGPMLDNRHIATAYAEIQAGHEDPTIFLDYEKKEIIRQQPNRIEFTLVCDGSGSMTENNKDTTQRLIAVLVTEAFARFRSQIKREQQEGSDINLDVLSEVRIFNDNDEVIVPLSPSITHEQRVKMHKRLKNLGGDNNEVDTLKKMREEQFGKKTLQSLRDGDLKKIILFLTDGESNKEKIQIAINNLAPELSEHGRKNLVVAGIGFDGGIDAKTTYAPNGYYANDLSEIAGITTKFIEEMLKDV